MYFTDDDHKGNFNRIMNLYHLKPGDDVQYESNIYIASYSDILKCIQIDMLDTTAGPLFFLTKWNEELEKYVVDSPGLTGSTRRLVEVGLSLYNSFDVGLDDVFSSIAEQELIEVFFQACKIRARI